MRLIQCLVLFILLSATVTAFTQQSQETIDALQLQRIERAERDTADNQKSIAHLTVEIAALRSSLDRFTGMGLGIGATLAALQALLVMLTFKNGRK